MFTIIKQKALIIALPKPKKYFGYLNFSSIYTRFFTIMTRHNK